MSRGRVIIRKKKKKSLIGSIVLCMYTHLLFVGKSVFYVYTHTHFFSLFARFPLPGAFVYNNEKTKKKTWKASQRRRPIDDLGIFQIVPPSSLASPFIYPVTNKRKRCNARKQTHTQCARREYIQ